MRCPNRILPPRCSGCGFRENMCMCELFAQTQNETHVIVLQQKIESYKPSNTGRIVHRVLKNSELILRGEKNHPVDICELQSRYHLAALYPYPDSLVLSPSLLSDLSLKLPPALIVFDGTWQQGSRMAKQLRDKGILFVKLPDRIHRTYWLRDSGADNHLSTCETVIQSLYLLGETEQAKVLEHVFQLFVQKHLKLRGKDIH